MIAQTVIDSDFGILFFAIVVIFLVSTLYPVSRRLPFARAVAMSSACILPLWLIYESLLPPEMNIRIDLFIIIPIVLLAFAIFAFRVTWLLGSAPTTNDA